MEPTINTIIAAIISFVVAAILTRVTDWFLWKEEKEEWANEKEEWANEKKELRELRDELRSMKDPWPRDTARFRDTDSRTDAVLSEDIQSIRILTQAEYDAITPKDENTLYFFR